MNQRRPWTIALGMCLAVARVTIAADDAPDRTTQEQLAALAAKCDELGLESQAELTRQWHVDRDPHRQHLFLVPPVVQPNPDAERIERLWLAKFMQIRRERAQQLFGQARQLSADGHAAAAYQRLYEALREDPTHAESRRVLSLPEPRSQPKLRAKPARRRHRDFGWQPSQHWYVDTPHFRVTTNHSAAAAEALITKLEELHTVWRQLFFRYWSTSQSLEERFAGRPALLGRSHKHNVILFRDREEYIRQLRQAEPNIEITLGYYSKQSRRSFFYMDDASIEPTWFHEATHQLFQEADGSRPAVGEDANFWIAEGIAVYMESLIRRDGYYTVGGFDANRLQYARRHTLLARQHTPLAELARLGRERFQQHPDIKRLYTQSAGLAHLLMDGEKGKYRERCVDYLAVIYRGRDNADTFAKVVGVDPAELDAAYPKFLDVTDDQLAFTGPASIVRNLALPFTSITDDGLQHLARHDQLEWVDVCFTDITDNGVRSLGQAGQLQVLNLEATEITDGCLEFVGQFQHLEHLDLSQNKITDDGLRHLAGLTKLTELWLTGTQITDDGLQHLTGLTNLEVLDVSKTDVTPAALARLEQQLPKLNRE